MKYIFFSIYTFYKNVVRIEYWGDTPFFYCYIVFALLESFILFSVVNYYLLYTRKGEYIDYPVWLFFTVTMVFFFLNRSYFKGKEKKIINGISLKSKNDKNIILLLSFFSIVITIIIYFHTGNLIRSNNGF